MPDRISISELHGYLIDERNSGSLSEIPATLYEVVHAELLDLINEARSMADPFDESVQILLKERESLREYIRDLYFERTRKIFSLALAKSTGEEINPDDLRAMVPGELSLYEIVVDAATACRNALLDGKHIIGTPSAFNFTPSSETEMGYMGSVLTDPSSFVDAHHNTTCSNDNLDAETISESYQVIMVQDSVEKFQDYSGRCYSLFPGDIISLPESIAEILCNRRIALNIRLRK
ncbi:MAG TPA: DNA replication complex GINS family protein [Methanocorpusculum sp.]|nr:DNA replication complex GINS family protein [Methanocorpusculum sp.]